MIRVMLATLIVLLCFTMIAIDYHETPYTGFAVYSGVAVDDMVNNLDDTKTSFNKNVEYMPDYAKTVFGNERINLNITRESGEVNIVGIITEEGVVVEMVNGSIENATLNIQTDEKTINEIVESEDQITTFREAFDEEEIEFKATRFGLKVKMWFAKLVLKIMGWFGK